MRRIQVGYVPFLGTNYGTILQTYALYSAVEQLGYHCRMISGRGFTKRKYPDLSLKKKNLRQYESLEMRALFSEFIRNEFKFSLLDYTEPVTRNRYGRIFPLMLMLIKTLRFFGVRRYKSFLCGSDQIWKPISFWFRASRYLYDFPVGKTIAYAPSVGWSKIPPIAVGNIPQWKKWLSHVQYVSCRETAGAHVIEALTEKKVTVVVDPTLLLTSETWSLKFPDGKMPDKLRTAMNGRGYVLAYLLDTYEAYKEKISEFAFKENLDVVWLVGRDVSEKKMLNCSQTDPAGFINLVKNARFVVVDGFHGSCFSINFEKPFLYLNNPLRGKDNSRIIDLFDRMDIDSSFLSEADELTTASFHRDYTKTREKLSKERKASLAFLKKSLELSSAERTSSKEWRRILDIEQRPIRIMRNRLKNIAERYRKKKNKDDVNPPDKVPLTDDKDCSGCGSCLSSCPTGAIVMTEGEFGFRYPEVQSEKCISCGRCIQRCPTLSPPELSRSPNTVAYAACSEDKKVLVRSASGAMFPAFAEHVIKDGGVVFGVAFNEELQAFVGKAETVKALTAFQGSKYVQADTGVVFTEVESELKGGRKVLYSGTACQIAGLYAYLGKDYDNLTTVDIICSGVPSQRTLNQYIDWREKQLSSKIIELKFREKKVNGWGQNMLFVLENGKKYTIPMQKDEYGISFMKHCLQRPACYNCRYRGVVSRISDMTIGDYWGIGSLKPPFGRAKQKGVSVVLTNSKKGECFFKKTCVDNDEVYVEKRKIETVFKGNAWLLRSFPLSENYYLLQKAMEKITFEESFSKVFGDSNVRSVAKPKRFLED